MQIQSPSYLPACMGSHPCTEHGQITGDNSQYPGLDGYPWGDRAWITWRQKNFTLDRPINIYEVHLGSWRRGEGGKFLTYRESAQWLIPYAKEMGYTHVEFSPVIEYFQAPSQGHRCTGAFACTGPLGTPYDFMYLVDSLHKAGIGVLLDWACSHRTQDLLLSSALFWLEKFHMDGLRVVGLDSLLRPDGQQEDPQAIKLLQNLNKTVSTLHPGVLMIADDSYARPGITRPVQEGGLGFHLKWDSGRLHDLYRFTKPAAPLSEFSLLPLSHQEVTHGKGSLLNKMPGSDTEKFAAVRAFHTYMLAHPGKKLTMMGCEFGQWQEWNFEHSLDWHLPEGHEAHRRLQAFFKAANAMYLEQPALWQLDFTPEGFRPLCSDDPNGNPIVFCRKDKQGRELLAAINFSPVFRKGCRVGVPQAGRYEEVFNTDHIEFGGEGRLNPPIKSEFIPCQSFAQSISVDIPPMGAVILNCTRKSPPQKAILSTASSNAEQSSPNIEKQVKE